MNVRIMGIDKTLLNDIIEKIGSLSISRCEPRIQENHLLFDISLDGKINLYVAGNEMALVKGETSITINQCRFSRVVII